MPLINTRTPAIDRHASRRSRFLIVLAVLLAGASVAHAEMPVIGGAAQAGTPAERIEVEGQGLRFPMQATPKCEIFNNFGGYSKVNGSGGHEGVDIGATLGQEVYAVEDGYLYDQFTNTGPAGWGWGLHGVSNTRYRYYHLDGFAEGLNEGDSVVAGQLIGYVGDTGNATPGGYHLHFEVRPGPGPRWNTPVDPVPLLAIPRACNLYPKQ